MAVHKEPDGRRAKALLSYLEKCFPAHLALGQRMWQADGGAIYPLDMVATAVLQRSMDLTRGFILLVRADEHACAVPLLRLQLDNILRLFAASLFPGGGEVLTAILEGSGLNKLRGPSKNGRPGRALTDTYLCELAAASFAWLPELYSVTARTIHLSSPALFSTITKVDPATRSYEFALHESGGRSWSESEKATTVEWFVKATEGVCATVEAWIVRKSAKGSHDTLAEG